MDPIPDKYKPLPLIDNFILTRNEEILNKNKTKIEIKTINYKINIINRYQKQLKTTFRSSR